jgi:hypothetical protein
MSTPRQDWWAEVRRWRAHSGGRWGWVRFRVKRGARDSGGRRASPTRAGVVNLTQLISEKGWAEIWTYSVGLVPPVTQLLAIVGNGWRLVEYIVIGHHIFLSGVSMFSSSLHSIEHSYLLPSWCRRYVRPSSLLTKMLDFAEAAEVLESVRNCQTGLGFLRTHRRILQWQTDHLQEDRAASCVSQWLNPLLWSLH